MFHTSATRLLKKSSNLVFKKDRYKCDQSFFRFGIRRKGALSRKVGIDIRCLDEKRDDPEQRHGKKNSAKWNSSDRNLLQYGTMKLKSAIGLARAFKPDKKTDAILAGVQNDLFNLGAELATPGKP